MTITITDPDSIERLTQADVSSLVKDSDGMIIGTFMPTPRKVKRLAELSPFTDEDLARMRAEIGDDPTGRTWKEIRKDLEAMG